MTVKHESKVVSNLGENDASAGKPKSCWKRELIPVAKEEEFTSENPFFTIRITPTYARQYFVVLCLVDEYTSNTCIHRERESFECVDKLLNFSLDFVCSIYLYGLRVSRELSKVRNMWSWRLGTRLGQ